jgi:predicted CopG family antitoxin
MAERQLRLVVYESTWLRLNKEKKAGDTFNDVVIRLLDLKERSKI